MPNPRHCGGSGGCKGATAQLAFEYALEHGLVEDKQWPYKLTSTNGEKGVMKMSNKCPSSLIQTHHSSGIRHVKLKDGSTVSLLAGKKSARVGSHPSGLYGWTKFKPNKIEGLVKALNAFGPITVSLAPGEGWYMYNKGVLNGDLACNKQNVIGHANVLFGYGKEGEQKYWHLLNSWGKDWGERGTLKLERSDDEESRCGWDHEPKKGNGCDGGPDKVEVCGTCGILYNPSVPHFQPLNF